MKFNKVDLPGHHINVVRVKYTVTPAEDADGTLADLVMYEPFVGVEHYSLNKTEHLLIGTVEYDELNPEALAVQIQIHDSDVLGMSLLKGPERAADLIPIMWKLPRVTRAH